MHYFYLHLTSSIPVMPTLLKIQERNEIFSKRASWIFSFLAFSKRPNRLLGWSNSHSPCSSQIHPDAFQAHCVWITRTSENCFWNITFLLDGKSIIFLPSTFFNQHHFSHGKYSNTFGKIGSRVGRRIFSKSMTRKIDSTVDHTSLV